MTSCLLPRTKSLPKMGSTPKEKLIPRGREATKKLVELLPLNGIHFEFVLVYCVLNFHVIGRQLYHAVGTFNLYLKIVINKFY